MQRRSTLPPLSAHQCRPHRSRNWRFWSSSRQRPSQWREMEIGKWLIIFREFRTELVDVVHLKKSYFLNALLLAFSRNFPNFAMMHWDFSQFSKVGWMFWIEQPFHIKRKVQSTYFQAKITWKLANYIFYKEPHHNVQSETLYICPHLDLFAVVAGVTFLQFLDSIGGDAGLFNTKIAGLVQFGLLRGIQRLKECEQWSLGPIIWSRKYGKAQMKNRFRVQINLLTEATATMDKTASTTNSCIFDILAMSEKNWMWKNTPDRICLYRCLSHRKMAPQNGATVIHMQLCAMLFLICALWKSLRRLLHEQCACFPGVNWIHYHSICICIWVIFDFAPFN